MGHPRHYLTITFCAVTTWLRITDLKKILGPLFFVTLQILLKGKFYGVSILNFQIDKKMSKYIFLSKKQNECFPKKGLNTKNVLILRLLIFFYIGTTLV
jgi:hypothetical protein